MNVSLQYEHGLAAARDYIERNDDFIIVSHVQPDGDATSSTLAMGLLLKYLNKRFIMVNEGALPAKFQGLNGYPKVVNYSQGLASGSYRFVIALDCADFSRIGRVREWFAEDAELLNIDHHPTNDRYGTINAVKDDAAATVELLYDLSNLLQVAWSMELAECIYTGLLTDTGGFRYPSTSPKVMGIASEMLAYGVNGSRLAEIMLETITHSHLRLLGKAIATLSFNSNRLICWVSITLADMEQCGAVHDDLEGIVNYPRNVEGVEVGLMFRETPGAVKVSLRSAGKVDVARIAKELGGGGHTLAAGVTVNGMLSDVMQLVLQRVEKEL